MLLSFTLVSYLTIVLCPDPGSMCQRHKPANAAEHHRGSASSALHCFRGSKRDSVSIMFAILAMRGRMGRHEVAKAKTFGSCRGSRVFGVLLNITVCVPKEASTIIPAHQSKRKMFKEPCPDRRQ